MTDLQECKECAAKPGSLTLCQKCVTRRLACVKINPTYQEAPSVGNIYVIPLTKREKFAMTAMQGILSSKYFSELCNDNTNKKSGCAKAAIEYADALLKELDDET